MKSYLSLLIAFLFIQAASAVGKEQFDSKIGCQINNNLEFVSGLKGSVYYYPWLDYNPATKRGTQNTDLYTLKPYLSGGYAGDGSIIRPGHYRYTSPGVVANDVTASQLNFDFSNLCSSDGNCLGEIWKNLDYFTNSDGSPLRVPFKTFAFHMSGYLVPNVTGQHILNLAYIDDLAIINIGSNGFTSPNCCGNYSPTGDVSGNNTIQTIWTANGPSGVNQAVLNLVAGVAYPIEFFYVNRGGAGGMKFKYTDPNGVTRYSFDGFVYHLTAESVCSYIEKHVVTLEWDQSTTSQSFTTTTDFLTKTNSYFSDYPITYTGTIVQETEIYYVPIPTVTTYWTGLSTSTKTSYSTTTDTDGSSLTSSVYYVYTPEQTTTVPWTGSYTLTTSSNTVTTDSLNNIVTSPIVVIKTPKCTTIRSNFVTSVNVSQNATSAVSVQTSEASKSTKWNNTNTTSALVTTTAESKILSITSDTFVLETSTPITTITTAWSNSFNTSSTTEVDVTPFGNLTLTTQVIGVVTPSFSGWNTTTLKTSSVDIYSVLTSCTRSQSLALSTSSMIYTSTLKSETMNQTSILVTSSMIHTSTMPTSSMNSTSTLTTSFMNSTCTLITSSMTHMSTSTLNQNSTLNPESVSMNQTSILVTSSMIHTSTMPTSSMNSFSALATSFMNSTSTLKPESTNQISTLPTSSMNQTLPMKTSSIEKLSTSITASIVNNTKTVTCTEYSCLTKNQESISTFTTSIKTSFVSSSSNSGNVISSSARTEISLSKSKSISSVSTVPESATPSSDIFTKSSLSPSVVTIDHRNKANTLSVCGLVILLLQFI